MTCPNGHIHVEKAPAASIFDSQAVYTAAPSSLDTFSLRSIELLDNRLLEGIS